MRFEPTLWTRHRLRPGPGHWLAWAGTVGLAGWLGVVALPAQAQPMAQAVATLPAGSVWSVWLEAAWARQPQAAAWGARQDEAQARRAAAEQLTPGPASATLGQVSDAGASAQGRRDLELELSTPLWRPGQQDRRQQLAQAQAAEAQAQRELARWQLAGELREAGWALVAARQAQDLAEQRQRTADALWAEVQRRWAAGELARLDANAAQAEALAARAEWQQSQWAAQQAERAFSALTGQSAPAELPPEAEPAPPDELASPADRAASGPAAWPDFSQHPALRASQAAAATARRRLADASAAGAGQPELALRWLSERGDASQARQQAWGVSLRLPFGSAGTSRAEQAAAHTDEVQALAQQQWQSQQLQQAWQDARHSAQATQAQRPLAQAQLALAADSLQLLQRAFDLGEADLPSLLRARQTHHDALARVRALDTTWALARARLNQALGTLP